jgi:uncharacterized membrane protein
MGLFLFLIVLVGFLYLVSRINNLETQIKRLRQSGVVSNPYTTQTSKQAVQASSPANLADAAPAFVPVAEKLQSPVTVNNNRDLEFKLGGKFFTIVGAVAVLFGVGFFLRFAFEQNLITETMRVVLGVLAGFVLIGLGDFLRRKYANYGQILQGTGVGILYLSVFAAYAFYGMLNQPSAIVAMSVVSISGAFLALRANSQPLAGVAQFGAYLTPFLLGLSGEDPNRLFIYVAIVNVGVLLIAMWKLWRGLTLGSLVGSAIVYVAWHSQYYDGIHWTQPLFYLTLFYLTFLTVNIYRYFVEKTKSDENDLALVIFNPMFYFLAGYALMHPAHPDYVGIFAFLLGALYVALGLGISQDNPDAKIFHFGVAGVMFFIGIPIQFDKQWVTLGWAAEALLFMYYGLYKNLKGLQAVAHVVFMIATVRLMVLDSTNIQGTLAVFNGRALSFIAAAGILALAAYWNYRQANKIPAGVTVQKGFEVLAIQAHAALVVWLGLEITKFGDAHWMGITWSVLAAAALYVGISAKNFELRVLSYATALLAAVKVVLFDSEIGSIATFQPVFNMRVVSFMVTAVILSVMLAAIRKNRVVLAQQESDVVPKSLFMVINLMLLWILSLEVSSYFDKQIHQAELTNRQTRSLLNLQRASLSIAWSLYAGALLVLGIVKKSVAARLVSIALFAIVIFKVFLYDTSNLSNFYRFVSFISLGVILLLAGYLYNRYKDRIAEFIQVKP